MATMIVQPIETEGSQEPWTSIFASCRRVLQQSPKFDCELCELSIWESLYGCWRAAIICLACCQISTLRACFPLMSNRTTNWDKTRRYKVRGSYCSLIVQASDFPLQGSHGHLPSAARWQVPVFLRSQQVLSALLPKPLPNPLKPP